MNRQSLMNSFKEDDSSQEEMINKFNDMENLSIEDIEKYGDSDYVDKYYFTYSLGVNAKDLTEATDQLVREKQKTKSYYGVGEIQFRRYFEMASNKKGITGENLLQILESRLDNVVYRLGYGSSRAQARQFVTHGHFDVNGKKVNIASYLVKAGDVISVREIKKDNKTIKANLEENNSMFYNFLFYKIHKKYFHHHYIQHNHF